jgi:hypothetical protein
LWRRGNTVGGRRREVSHVDVDVGALVGIVCLVDRMGLGGGRSSDGCWGRMVRGMSVIVRFKVDDTLFEITKVVDASLCAREIVSAHLIYTRDYL